MKEHFNENLLMAEEEEHLFQQRFFGSAKN